MSNLTGMHQSGAFSHQETSNAHRAGAPPLHPRSLYFAASLFNAKDTTFNVELAEHLQDNGFKVFLPQRDGFEFSECLQTLMDEEFGTDGHMKSKAFSWMIYLLDIGSFMHSADVVLANLDEPQDPGVIVEIMSAKQMGKKVVGYRTEFRSPHGEMGDYYNGMHWFTMLPCDEFIFFPLLEFKGRHDNEKLRKCSRSLP